MEHWRSFRRKFPRTDTQGRHPEVGEGKLEKSPHDRFLIFERGAFVPVRHDMGFSVSVQSTKPPNEAIQCNVLRTFRFSIKFGCCFKLSTDYRESEE